jgi:hypothetical protein
MIFVFANIQIFYMQAKIQNGPQGNLDKSFPASAEKALTAEPVPILLVLLFQFGLLLFLG